jgi:hypothetical protein
MFTSLERNFLRLETLIKKGKVREIHMQKVNVEIKTEYTNTPLSHLMVVKLW